MALLPANVARPACALIMRGGELVPRRNASRRAAALACGTLRQSLLEMRCLALVLFLVAAYGCPALRSGAAAQPAASAERAARSDEPDEGEPDEGESSGLGLVNRSLGELKRALDAKDFDAARDRLSRAEAAIKNADERTQGHPDFEDASAAVAKARERLDKAIEQDRVDRRNAAIDSLIDRGLKLGERGKVILAELASRVPTKEDLGNLDEVAAGLSALDSEGREHLSEKRYFEHAAARDRFAITITAQRRLMEWQMAANDRLGAVVASAVGAVEEAKQAQGADAIAAWSRARDALIACAESVKQLEAKPGFDGTRLVSTKMGTLPINDTKARCEENAGKIRGQLDRLVWQKRVEAVAERLTQTLSAWRSAGNAADKLAAADGALTALGECRTDLQAAAKAPGSDPQAKLSCPLGEMKVAQLAKACAQEHKRVSAQVAVLRRAIAAETKAGAKGRSPKAKGSKRR